MVDSVLLGQYVEKAWPHLLGWPLFFGTCLAAGAALAMFIAAANKKNRPPTSPNLAPCPDCYQPVSVRAQTCPHCGAPLKPSA